MYYKFRDLKNYQYVLDILVNQRLYASSFRNLNDNFEGQFYSDEKRLRLNPRKKEHISVCSFSENYKSHLMWSHYAEGHRGIVIGFIIDDDIYKIEKVNYNGLSILEYLPHKIDDVKSVLLNKIEDWKYEQEYRIITEKQGYINIEIKQVIFGTETPNVDKEIITNLVRLINSEIEIITYNG